VRPSTERPKEEAARRRPTTTSPTARAGSTSSSATSAPPSHLYLTPRGDGDAPSAAIVRYDTTAPLSSAASWSRFDVATALVPGAGAFRSAAFDGRFTYFASFRTGPWVRVDSTQPFTEPASWSQFDPNVVAPDLHGMHGMVFDGRFVYGVPFNGRLPDGGAPAGPAVARFDTQAAFADPLAWTVHRFSPAQDLFHGGAFDGRFVWLVPHYGGSIVRYDTQAPFDSDASWQALSVTTLIGTRGLNGVVFDGRYLHFAPAFEVTGAEGSPAHALMLRCDTRGAFDVSACDVFDLAKARAGAQGYAGGTFDGRFVWFAPHSSAAWEAGPRGQGLVARYDTLGAHDAPGSWSFFDTQVLHPDADAFMGMLFDGRWVYLLPTRKGVLVRFDARDPAGLPDGWNRSFL
jgi:hypothetical protein